MAEHNTNTFAATDLVPYLKTDSRLYSGATALMNQPNVQLTGFADIFGNPYTQNDGLASPTASSGSSPYVNVTITNVPTPDATPTNQTGGAHFSVSQTTIDNLSDAVSSDFWGAYAPSPDAAPSDTLHPLT